jgi:hypothetical protein
LVIVRWATDRRAVAFSASEAKPKTADRQIVVVNQNALRFGGFSFADACSAPTVGEYADATAWQSVAHLTITNAKKNLFGITRVTHWQLSLFLLRKLLGGSEVVLKRIFR